MCRRERRPLDWQNRNRSSRATANLNAAFPRRSEFFPRSCKRRDRLSVAECRGPWHNVAGALPNIPSANTSRRDDRSEARSRLHFEKAAVINFLSCNAPECQAIRLGVEQLIEPVKAARVTWAAVNLR